MNHTRIKVCGITRSEDARHCEAAGVDAIGFVFVERSKRYITIDQAGVLSSSVGPFMTRVGLFLNPERECVERALSALPDMLVQFHGTESAEFCDQLDRPYIKSFGVGSGMPSQATLASYQHAAGFLFDSNAAGELGGTGHRFDWNTLKNDSDTPLILAGGLDADNIASAIQIVRPYAVDVSTGVETAPGVKNETLIRQFVSNAAGVRR